jgi:hypothetical protein
MRLVGDCATNLLQRVMWRRRQSLVSMDMELNSAACLLGRASLDKGGGSLVHPGGPMKPLLETVGKRRSGLASMMPGRSANDSFDLVGYGNTQRSVGIRLEMDAIELARLDGLANIEKIEAVLLRKKSIEVPELQ